MGNHGNQLTRGVQALAVLTLLTAAGQASAQSLADLQPGRNFTSSANFGTNRSENIDPGDVDNDGDMDVGVANGGDFGKEANRLFINLGGLQGGTVGLFTEETATRFAGVTLDTSRDIEFVDVDNDADLDVFIANRGNLVNGGEPSRFYTNLGGLQGGTIGFFQEDTNLRWGQLVGVPLGDQVFGGNAGPFREYSCDCDFADLDDDGDSDLFFSSYGPALNGTRESRIFLNSGSGVFDELYPWANAGADIKLHTFDMDLADLDGDFDIDISMSSRDSQARQYINNLYNPLSSSPFQDTTQWALLTGQPGGSASVNYETEYADVDGDGDFDLWMLDYNGNLDRVFRNDGFTPGQGAHFTQMNAWLKGDPNVDENEIDFIDYDGDGDLDAFIANFSGTNYMYQSGLAQGLHYDTVGLFHRTGLASGLSPNPELPSTFNGNTTLDADVADIDNDGDDDLLLCNDANQQNYLFRNVLGVPDTHAPTFYKLTVVPANVPNGIPQVVHAQIRDNTSYYLTSFYPAVLHYSVNNGPDVALPMFAQGSMQFRGVIPAQTDATVSYYIECADLAGNISACAVMCYEQGVAPTPWSNLGFGLAGIAGVPTLTGTGSLVAQCPLTLDLANARPAALAALFLSITSTPVPFKGGMLAAFPPLSGFPLLLSTGAGTLSLPATMPSGTSGLGLELFLQYAIADAAAVKGVALSNALKGDVP